VGDKTTVITAVNFEGVRAVTAEATVDCLEDSEAAGAILGKELFASDLAAVLVFGKGLDINGSALIDGLVSQIGPKTPISGGLAGDDGAFKKTFVLTPSGIASNKVVALGLYGDRLVFGHGSFGGWEPFGPTRTVSKSVGNILYELDGEPALNIYKRYLGDYASELPASGLLFPFEMLNENHDSVGLIRTILGVNETDGSLVLAGAIEEGGFLRLMHANTDALVIGAENAAKITKETAGSSDPGLAILVSCVGRKLVMGDQVDDEIDAVVDVLGKDNVVTGFYSYGEISPMQGNMDCKLHNQTMTVAFLSER